MSLLLRKLLSRFLTLGVVGDEPPADPPADPPEGGEEQTLDDLTALGDEDPPADEPTETPAEKKARERAETAERERDEERRTRRALETNAIQAPRRPDVDPETAREEQQLEAARKRGASQAELDMLAWTHQSNRTIRQANTAAQTALRRAEDVRDQTSFERLEVTQPAIYKKYAKRVEAEVEKLQANGQNAPRKAILSFLIGQDMLEGKTKGTTKAAPAPAVDRGRMPPARTDVSGRRGAADERTKRIERLKSITL